MTRSGLALLAVVVPAALLLALVTLGANVERFTDRESAPARGPAGARASAVHQGSVVVDLHADSLLWGRDLTRRSSIGHVDLPRLREGNVALQVLTIVTRFPVTAS